MGEVFVEDDAELARLLGRSSEMRDALMETAAAVATEARELARREAFDTGAYMRGIVPQSVGDTSVLTTAPDGGLIAQVRATEWKSALVEFGGARTPPKAILRRAGESHANFQAARS